MKKLIIVSICVLALFAMVSCATTAAIEFNPTIDLTIDGEDVANVTIVPNLNGKSSLLSDVGTVGYSLTVENKTNSVIKIVWEKSAIYYSGNSSVPFITGQKYIDHNSPMSPTVIPANGKNTTGVYSGDQVYYVSGSYGGWRMANIPSFDTQVLICIESGGAETYYTFTITGNPIYPPEE